MSEHIMDQAKRAAIQALLAGHITVIICGLVFPLVHMHDNEYGLFGPYGEVFRLVKRGGSISVIS